MYMPAVKLSTVVAEYLFNTRENNPIFTDNNRLEYTFAERKCLPVK